MTTAKKSSAGRYSALWDDIWKVSLKHQICPFARCDLSKGSCEHLDRHANYDTSARLYQPSVYFIHDIEEKAVEATQPKGEIWELFKKLRRYGLGRDQIGILLRKFGKDMSRAEILEDMNWTSNQTYDRRYRDAIATLKRRGYK